MKLLNTILNYYEIFEYTLSRTVVNMMVEDSDVVGDLLITDYKRLQALKICSHSLRSICSLTITKNPSLKYILFEDRACKYATELTLSSLIDLFHFIGSS